MMIAWIALRVGAKPNKARWQDHFAEHRWTHQITEWPCGSRTLRRRWSCGKLTRIGPLTTDELATANPYMKVENAKTYRWNNFRPQHASYRRRRSDHSRDLQTGWLSFERSCLHGATETRRQRCWRRRLLTRLIGAAAEWCVEHPAAAWTKLLIGSPAPVTSLPKAARFARTTPKYVPRHSNF